jgi:hypothetical protein
VSHLFWRVLLPGQDADSYSLDAAPDSTGESLMFFIDPYETLIALRKAREEVRKQVDQDRKIAKLEADVQALTSRVAAQEEANLVEKYGDAALAT